MRQQNTLLRAVLISVSTIAVMAAAVTADAGKAHHSTQKPVAESATDAEPGTAAPAADPGTTPIAAEPDTTAGTASLPKPPDVRAPDVWPPEIIAAAKLRCDAILKRIDAVAIREAPIKDGACGAPAPIRLISIGKSPQVSISPPAILTCELAEALNTWVENDLQPLAKAQLGAEIIEIETMSSYSCRNAYGRSKNKLSEHGVANALDIRGFVTASAKTAYVLEDWGKPQREINAEIAAAIAAEEKLAAARAAAEKAAQTNQVAGKAGSQPAPVAATPPSATASTAGAPAAGIARTTITEGIPKLTVTLPGAKPAPKPAVGFAEPDKLGGPKAGAMAASQPLHKTDFLHLAHTSACKIFGTTLGPEANSEHRNHFHDDMAERKVIKICD